MRLILMKNICLPIVSFVIFADKQFSPWNGRKHKAQSVRLGQIDKWKLELSKIAVAAWKSKTVARFTGLMFNFIRVPRARARGFMLSHASRAEHRNY